MQRGTALISLYLLLVLYVFGYSLNPSMDALI